MTCEDAAAQVWRELKTVIDPELDQPLTELGFIDAVEVDADFRVRVRFKLPTYWCAANFAFMMAEDVREAVARLRWVHGVSVELADHYSAPEINHGVAARLPFSAAFPEEATGDLDELRRLFRAKAFLGRQERLLRDLIAASYSTSELLALSIGELRALQFKNEGSARARDQYLALREEFGDQDLLSPAFVTPAGRPLRPEAFAEHLRQLRRTSANIEFNAALCGTLLRARYGSAEPSPDSSKASGGGERNR
ncbi:MAG: metal-sulfur cluster assembly factor [Pseudomonadota bacterium]